MASKASQAKCLLCESRYSGTGISRHLQSCIPKSMEKTKQKEKSPGRPFFHLLIKGYYLPDYWLHLLVDSHANLNDIDQFLRDIWLECCGHLSVFFNGKAEFDMNEQLNSVLVPGMELKHLYDFGSSTVLLVNVLGTYASPGNSRKQIQILARNEAPVIPCDECGTSPAVKVCTVCQWDGKGWLCGACADKHVCGEEVILPVVNSPRTGVCGYGEYSPSALSYSRSS